MTDSTNRCPWTQPDAKTWLSGNEALRRLTQLVARTLEADPRQFPMQTRAAAAIAILLAREGFWPASGDTDWRDAAGQARRNLAVVRELFSVESKRNTEMGEHVSSLHRLLKAIETEMRILDARLSDEPLNIPNEPPETWGAIWPKP